MLNRDIMQYAIGFCAGVVVTVLVISGWQTVRSTESPPRLVAFELLDCDVLDSPLNEAAGWRRQHVADRMLVERGDGGIRQVTLLPTLYCYERDAHGVPVRSGIVDQWWWKGD